MFVLHLTFDGDPRRLAARPAHRARLTELHAAGRLVMAGPWHDDSGALLVFRADGADSAEIDEILASDPYYTTPGVTIDALRQWSPIVGSP
ncbi:MAG TPA: YciI family protein [Amycolatopsis sp.]|nr:YciI family protein [Amycolatopsis sp.]